MSQSAGSAPLPPHTWPQRLWRLAATGGTCTLFQLLLAVQFAPYLSVFWTGALAYVISGQLSFLMHSAFSWSDRHPGEAKGWDLFRIIAWRWCKFTALNWAMGSFNGLLQREVTEYFGSRLIAWVAGNIITMPTNVALQNYVVFRNDDPPTELVERNN